MDKTSTITNGKTIAQVESEMKSAGKSTLCPYYLKTQCFDGDLMALNLRKEHPDWPDRWISGTVAGNLEKQKDYAIENYQNFAFETNFSNNLIINLVNDFKNANFKISLYSLIPQHYSLTLFISA